MQRLSLGVKNGIPDGDLGEALEGLGLVAGAGPTLASLYVVESWFGVEEKKDVARAVIADLKDDLCDLLLAH